MVFGRIRCFVCDAVQIRRITAPLYGENVLKHEIAIARRDDRRLPIAVLSPESRICLNCNRNIDQEIRAIEDNPQHLRLNVLTPNRHHSCVICGGLDNLHRLTLKCRIHIYVKRNIFATSRSVCCEVHLDERRLFPDNVLQLLRYVNRPVMLDGQEILSFMNALREYYVNYNRFEDEHDITENDFRVMTGLSKDQYRDLFTYCNPVLVEGKNRYISKKDLLCFLFKMRQDLSDNCLCVIFQYPTRQSTSLAIATVRQSLIGRFALENIGFEAITREEYIQRHITNFSNRLYNIEPQNRRAIVYNDCTYIQIEKSSNFKTLRQSYCVHKGKHLVKPSIFVAPNGYILDIQGPYFSNAANNDARIVIDGFLRDINGMRRFFRPLDIFVLDRGYRDAIGFLERLGFHIKMPHLLRPGESQFTAEEANESRIVTKTRWVVESRNGHMKHIFKFFDGVISTAHVPHLNDFLRIAGSIINKYYGPINMDADEALAERILQRVHEPNIVQARIDAENLRGRRARWINLTADLLPLFPRLTLQFLRELAYGTYQVHLAPSYIQDTVLRAQDDDENDDIDQALQIDRNTDEPGFIRIRTFSRFRNATNYQLWIAFNEEYNNENEACEDNIPIFGHYCTCKVGARTLGMCSHISSVLWYLGYARYQEIVKYPSLRVLRSIQYAEMDIDDVNIIDPDLDQLIE